MPDAFDPIPGDKCPGCSTMMFEGRCRSCGYVAPPPAHVERPRHGDDLPSAAGPVDPGDPHSTAKSPPRLVRSASRGRELGNQLVCGEAGIEDRAFRLQNVAIFEATARDRAKPTALAQSITCSIAETSSAVTPEATRSGRRPILAQTDRSSAMQLGTKSVAAG